MSDSEHHFGLYCDHGTVAALAVFLLCRLF